MDSTIRGSRAAVHRDDSDHIFADRFADRSDQPRLDALRILERLTFGARPADIQDYLALASSQQGRLEAWLDWQLDWQSIDDADLEQRLAAAGYKTLDRSISQLWADYVRGDMSSGWQRSLPVWESQAAQLMRAAYSRRQLHELLVGFWHDHFSVYGWEFSIAPVFVPYDRDAIRPHALGSFRGMLEAVARSTAMLTYLDNKDNRAGGYNENWARELLELHTLGSDVYHPGVPPGAIPIGDDGLAVGYSDTDVYEVARCFTGWTLRNGHWTLPDGPEWDTGEFFYNANWHENGFKFVLGRWTGWGDQDEGLLCLDWLSQHRQTARHLCTKLCRRLLADEPPTALVESAADVWQNHWESDQQIARVVRHILLQAEAAGQYGTKVRRPFEMLCAALRKTEAQFEPQPDSGWAPYDELFARLRQTGHGCYNWPSPDGYPDTADRWTSASALGQCWRLLSRLPELRQLDSDDFLMQIHSLTVAGIPVAERSAARLVDFWLQRLIGRAVDATRRTALINFLRQNAAPDARLDIEHGYPDGQWSGGNLSAHYTPPRLRATVAMIMMLPEFHQR